VVGTLDDAAPPPPFGDTLAMSAVEVLNGVNKRGIESKDDDESREGVRLLES